jgi:Na+-translocating ferredoxin:NAD+ oxidoreductase RNF subunit RnfB
MRTRGGGRVQAGRVRGGRFRLEKGMCRSAGGTDRDRSSGTAGLISGILSLVNKLRHTETKRGIIGRQIWNTDGCRMDTAPPLDLVIPRNSGSRQMNSSSLLASVNTEMCSGCGNCAQICPAGAISVAQVAVVNADNCSGCGRCVPECPCNALTMSIQTMRATMVREDGG